MVFEGVSEMVGGMSGYAALTRPTPCAFASITRERPATLGGSEKPLLSRRAAQGVSREADGNAAGAAAGLRLPE